MTYSKKKISSVKILKVKKMLVNFNKRYLILKKRFDINGYLSISSLNWMKLILFKKQTNLFQIISIVDKPLSTLHFSYLIWLFVNTFEEVLDEPAALEEGTLLLEGESAVVDVDSEFEDLDRLKNLERKIKVQRKKDERKKMRDRQT